MAKKTKTPKIKSHHRQLFVCMDGDCASSSKAKATRKALKRGLQAARKEEGIDHALCTGMECIGVCKGGPLVVVWPDGVWYHHVDEDVAERIVEEHIIGGEPVEDYIFYRIEGAQYLPEVDEDENA
ncbi:MAG: (2Fe-2S) ferredoxin domain-containing protein [Chloroflexi bacterium]|nr:(2Fe-2S) ferredoxin domain-containing protein [Chloroflexota bacterium]